MARTSETFGRLIRAAVKAIGALELKREQIVREELGELIGRSPAVVVHREEGQLSTEPHEIAVFAEAGVQRGLLGRVWLACLLEVTRYPDADHLLARLCPPITAPPTPARAMENLPAPPFSRFISGGSGGAGGDH